MLKQAIDLWGINNARELIGYIKEELGVASYDIELLREKYLH